MSRSRSSARRPTSWCPSSRQGPSTSPLVSDGHQPDGLTAQELLARAAGLDRLRAARHASARSAAPRPRQPHLLLAHRGFGPAGGERSPLSPRLYGRDADRHARPGDGGSGRHRIAGDPAARGAESFGARGQHAVPARLPGGHGEGAGGKAAGDGRARGLYRRHLRNTRPRGPHAGRANWPPPDAARP